LPEKHFEAVEGGRSSTLCLSCQTQSNLFCQVHTVRSRLPSRSFTQVLFLDISITVSYTVDISICDTSIPIRTPPLRLDHVFILRIEQPVNGFAAFCRSRAGLPNSPNSPPSKWIESIALLIQHLTTPFYDTHAISRFDYNTASSHIPLPLGRAASIRWRLVESLLALQFQLPREKHTEITIFDFLRFSQPRHRYYDLHQTKHLRRTCTIDLRRYSNTGSVHCLKTFG
jgi:hypothetical protein